MKMKHGIIIAGSGRGLYFADLLARTPGLKESCSVKAVADIRKENHDALRTRLNESGLTETKILTTLPEALEALPCEEAQSVLVVTPNTTHAELAEQSLRAGRHLLLEKPIAADWADAARIQQAAAKFPDRIIQLGFTLRYSTFYRKVVSIVESGMLGRVVMIRSNERLSFTHSSAYRRGWRRHTAATGGLMNEKCCHDLDLLNWILKKQAAPRKVYSVGGNELFPPHPEAPLKCADCTDHACVFRNHPERINSLRYGLAVDKEYYGNCIYHTDADVMTNQSVTVRYDDNSQAVFTIILYAGTDEQRDFMIHGTNGLLSGDLKYGRIELKLFRENTHEIFELPGGMHGDGDIGILSDFFACIKNGRQPDATVEDGILASKIAFAANLSVREERVVRLDEFKVQA